MKKNKHNGVTLVELCIVIVLMSVVVSLAVSLITLSLKAFSASEQILKVTMNDADFASKICTAVRRSGTAFTIPEQSFTDKNLTKGWSYLGLMHEVDIPADISLTGKEIKSTDALVYIEYSGTQEPTSIPANAVLINNTDGYFIMTILGHNYTDTEGREHYYSLKFEPENPDDHTTTSIVYSFASAYESEDGSLNEESSIETIVNALNAIQIVYQGSSTNPATAIAFRTDFIPTMTVEDITVQHEAGTVVMIMDVSGSMTGDRIKNLKSSAKAFIEELSTNPNLSILLTIFSDYADMEQNYNMKNKNYSINNPIRNLVNIADNKQALIDTIDSLVIKGDTNLGDGMRFVYNELLNHPETHDHPLFLLVFTDGAVNKYTTQQIKENNKTKTVPYYGNLFQFQPNFSGNNISCALNTDNGRAYFKYYGKEIKKLYRSGDTYAYIIDIYKGMSKADKTALQEVFNQNETFEASNLTQMQQVLTQIKQNIEDIMWAFKGPRI